MNYHIKCPDCQSDKLSLHGFGYESLSISPLLCMHCGLVFKPNNAIIEQGDSGNLKRLVYMMNQFSKAKAINLFRELTQKGKKEAKDYITFIRFEHIKTSN